MTTTMTTTTPPVRSGATAPAPSDGPGEASGLRTLRNLRSLRRGIWLLPAFGALTLWATSTHQPNPNEAFPSWSSFVTTDHFLAQHLVGSILGQAIAVLGTAALAVTVLLTGRRSRAAVWSFVLAVVGSAGLLAGFGVAALAQPAIGELELRGGAGARELYDRVYGPLTFVVLIGGAALFAAATVLGARAAAAIAGTPRWARWAYGASGPLVGVLGVAVGPLQTLGALGAVAGGTAIAVAAQRAAGTPTSPRAFGGASR